MCFLNKTCFRTTRSAKREPRRATPCLCVITFNCLRLASAVRLWHWLYSRWRRYYKVLLGSLSRCRKSRPHVCLLWETHYVVCGCLAWPTLVACCDTSSDFSGVHTEFSEFKQWASTSYFSDPLCLLKASGSKSCICWVNFFQFCLFLASHFNSVKFSFSQHQFPWFYQPRSFSVYLSCYSFFVLRHFFN